MYSRAGWVNQYLAGAAWLDDYDWWLATYLTSGAEHPGPPVLPKGVTSWLIHQTSSHGKGIGSESGNMDYDRWNGTVEDVYAYAGISQPPPGGVTHDIFL
jgi:GH25 family lysozyme M1 (1,4-beta-N-acetylmuramidase)